MSKDTSIVLKKEVAPIVATALSLKVKGKEDMVLATEYLSKLNKVADRIEEEKQKVLGPLNLARKAEMNRWKPVEDMYEEGIEHIRLAIGNYQTSEIKRQREEEAKIAARVGEGKGKLKIDTAMRKMDEIEKVEEKVVTDSGSLKFRETKVLVVHDVHIVPREYMVVDEDKVLGVLKSGGLVPGCTLEVKMVPINSR